MGSTISKIIKNIDKIMALFSFLSKNGGKAIPTSKLPLLPSGFPSYKQFHLDSSLSKHS